MKIAKDNKASILPFGSPDTARGCSSAGERRPHTTDVTGSIPVTPTIVPSSFLDRIAESSRSKYLYVFKCGDFYKIGIADDVDRRMANMVVGNPFDIIEVSKRLIHGFHVRYVEKKVHELLFDWRHRGEWFSAPIDKIEDAIREATTGLVIE